MKSKLLRNFLILIGVLIVTGSGLEVRSSSPEKKPTDKRLKFNRVLMCDYVDEEATKAGFRTYRLSNTHFGCTTFDASDGETLFASDTQFRSPEEAKRYLDWKVAKASKILSQGIKTDSQRKSVGYRAEVLLAPDQKQSAVMWTNGQYFYQIISQSLAAAEELEKR